MATTTAVVNTEKRPTLYDLSDDLQALVDTVGGCDDEDQLRELLDKQEITTKEFVAKIDSYVGYINRADAEIAALEEQKVLMNIAFDREIKRRTRNLTWLQYVAGKVLRTMGVREISGLIHKIRFHKNPDRTEIVEPCLIPNRYTSTTTTVTPDRKAILAALKRGEKIPGAELITGSDRVEFS